jgi:hypothetical protein
MSLPVNYLNQFSDRSSALQLHVFVKLPHDSIRDLTGGFRATRPDPTRPDIQVASLCIYRVTVPDSSRVASRGFISQSNALFINMLDVRLHNSDVTMCGLCFIMGPPTEAELHELT